MAGKDITDLLTVTSGRNFTNDTETEMSISNEYVYAIFIKCAFISYSVMLILGTPGHVLTFVAFTQTSLSQTSRVSLCVAPLLMVTF